MTAAWTRNSAAALVTRTLLISNVRPSAAIISSDLAPVESATSREPFVEVNKYQRTSDDDRRADWREGSLRLMQFGSIQFQCRNGLQLSSQRVIQLACCKINSRNADRECHIKPGSWPLLSKNAIVVCP